ncbi:endoribonuclease MazF [Planktothrix sp. FACHB-1365]|uniref:endoribonuclease MazF n=1 Tax=Planktothrix sp. FACHB-1365 TaxID=2692855 RepID=UPI00168981FB|nr:endoribonuclease MazF [Planktothrix sp. FACHB-1365]MBD2482839.1 endoribonuclease MazF [Planktothrix sp. FACHB-1365]
MNSDNPQLYIPRQGDIIWIDFIPQIGREQAGRRPAIVISKTTYNRRVGLALVCPITSRVKGYPFEVAIPEGLAVSGVVLADQIKSFDWQARQADFACKIPPEVLIEVVAKLMNLLPEIEI